MRKEDLQMIIAGVIGGEKKAETAKIISSIFGAKGNKVNIIDSSSLANLGCTKIRAYIKELEKNGTDLLILKASVPDAEKGIFDGVEFDFVIYTDRTDVGPDSEVLTCSSGLGRVFSLMDEKGVAIVNVDDSDIIQMLTEMKYRFVTYGFNDKASVTTSSIGDSVFTDGFICCLQQPISTQNGRIIEPQEYKLKFAESEFDSNSVLAAASFAIINDVDLNSFGENPSI